MRALFLDLGGCGREHERQNAERVVARWAKISVQGPAKTLITIHFGEKLNTNGTVEYQGALFHFPSFIYSYVKV
jgi:hypothetical protein